MTAFYKFTDTTGRYYPSLEINVTTNDVVDFASLGGSPPDPDRWTTSTGPATVAPGSGYTYPGGAATSPAPVIGPWVANVAYMANQAVMSPSGTVLTRLSGGTSRATFDTTEAAQWTASASAGMGTIAARPSAATFGVGYYLVTDVAGGTFYYSNGAIWTQLAAGVTQSPSNLGYTEFGPAGNAAPVSTASTSDQDVASFTMHLGSLPGSSYDVDLKAFGYNDNATGGVWVKVKESIDGGAFSTVISSIWGPTTAAGYRQFIGAIRRSPGVGGFPSGTAHTADYKVTLAAVTAGTAWLGDRLSSGVVCVLRSDRVF